MNLVIAVCIYLASLTAPIPTELAPATSIECVEDMECWNCQTMGNEICGQSGRLAYYVNGIEAMQ